MDFLLICVHQLGEHFQRSKIGEVLTPVGTLKMSVSYRSKDDMTITPQKVEKDFMMKSDYFKPDKSPQRVPSAGIRIQKNLNTQKSPNGKVGAFAPRSLPEGNMFPDLAILEKPFLNMSRSKVRNPEKQQQQEGYPNQNSDKNANLNTAAKTMDKADNYTKDDSGVDYNCNPSGKGEEKLVSSSGSSGSADYIVKPAFADYGEDDLGVFFRECQSAPPLAFFASQPTLEEQVSDISSQIAKYEKNMAEFDEFVDSICNMDLEK